MKGYIISITIQKEAEQRSQDLANKEYLQVLDAPLLLVRVERDDCMFAGEHGGQFGGVQHDIG